MKRQAVKARNDLRSPGFFLFALTILFVVQSRTQTIPLLRSLSFTGVTALSVNTLRDRFVSKEGNPLSVKDLESDVHELLQRYAAEGYPFCSAGKDIRYNPDSTRADVTIHVNEGNPVVVGRVEITAPANMDREELIRSLALGRGARFYPQAVEQGVQQMLEVLGNRGFPLPGAVVDSVSFERTGTVDSAHIAISVDPGAEVEMTELQIEGNTSTRRSVIEREIRLNENKVFSDAWARSVKNRLERLGLFSSVSPPAFYVTQEGKGGLSVRVTEGNPNRIDGIVGYVPSAGGERGYVTGLIDLEFKNLFGTARAFSARWSRETRVTENIALRYTEPWIASLPLLARGGFQQRKQDSTYLRRGYDAALSYHLSDAFSIGGSFQQVSVFPTERPNNPVLASRTVMFGGSVLYDVRDNPVNPKGGVFYSASYELGSKSFSGGNESVRKLMFDLEYYVSPFPQQVLAFALHGKTIESSSLEQGDVFQIGGTTTLRGYRESQFYCSRVAWINMEYRFLSGLRSQVYGFFDGAYIVLQNRPVAGLIGSEQLKAGFGVGARIESGIGIIGVSIGLGEGDTFRTAKLHIRLVNEF